MAEPPFTVATYNALASAYVRPERYPFTPPIWLDAERRIPALIEQAARLDVDVLCLQEVEETTYAGLAERLCPLGYAGDLAMKGHGKPDGCAMFWRARVFESAGVTRVVYDDGGAGERRSGHVAQAAALRTGGRLLVVANTHLKWDAPGVARDERWDHRQIVQLLRDPRLKKTTCPGRIICGDLNVTVNSDVVRTLREAGFEFSHVGAREAATCNSNGRVKMVDYLFHDGGLRAEPVALPPIEDTTPMPGSAHPSDHLPVIARFVWADAGTQSGAPG